jgi:hypothetical protein
MRISCISKLAELLLDPSEPVPPVITPRVTKILIKLLKIQLSLKVRENQVIDVSNQNLNYQHFKFEVSKCCLVWTYILSQQIFKIYWS